MNLFERFDRLAPGAITTIAGLGYTDGVPARDADAGWPLGVVRLPEGHPHAGELIVNDYQGQRIWRIDRKGILHTFAGDGVPGNRGDDGPASEARVCYPHDLCLDHEGNLYVGDFNCQLFRRIDAKTGVITRVVGSGKRGRGGDGDAAVDAETDTTCGIAVAANGDLYMSSEWSNNIRRVDARTGIITRFAGLDGRHYPLEAGGSRPYGGPGFSLQGYHGDGGPAAAAAFWHPEHLAFDSRGDLYVCDNSNDRIRKIDMTTGIVSTVLGNGHRASNGDGGPAAEASTLMPDALCFDAHDNMYVGEKYGFRIRRVDGASGIVTTLVGTGEPGFGEEGLHGSVTRCNSVESGIWADRGVTMAPTASSPRSLAARASTTAGWQPALSSTASKRWTSPRTVRSTWPIAGTSGSGPSIRLPASSGGSPATVPALTGATTARLRRPTSTTRATSPSTREAVLSSAIAA